MKVTKVNEKEINIIEGWDEITLGNYVTLAELYSKYSKEEIIIEQLMLVFLTLISDLTIADINKMDVESITNIFTENVGNFKIEDFVPKEQKLYVFNNITYYAIIPEKLSMGELISIRLLEKDSTTLYEQWLNRLCIIVRPATESIDEFGEKKYTPIEFEGDVDVLLKRKELFKNIPAVNALYLVEAFRFGS